MKKYTFSEKKDTVQDLVLAYLKPAKRMRTS